MKGRNKEEEEEEEERGVLYVWLLGRSSKHKLRMRGR